MRTIVYWPKTDPCCRCTVSTIRCSGCYPGIKHPCPNCACHGDIFETIFGRATRNQSRELDRRVKPVAS